MVLDCVQLAGETMVGKLFSKVIFDSLATLADFDSLEDPGIIGPSVHQVIKPMRKVCAPVMIHCNVVDL